MPAWTDAYIGIPFKANGREATGCDCWGLVVMVYAQQLGVRLPGFDGALGDGCAMALRQVAKTIAQQSVEWARYLVPQPFDVALFRNHGLPSHVGIVVDRNCMLHIADGIDACIERFDGVLWKHKLIGFYRHAR